MGCSVTNWSCQQHPIPALAASSPSSRTAWPVDAHSRLVQLAGRWKDGSRYQHLGHRGCFARPRVSTRISRTTARWGRVSVTPHGDGGCGAVVAVVVVVAVVSQESSVWRKKGGGGGVASGGQSGLQCWALKERVDVCARVRADVAKRDVVAVCYCLMCKMRRTGRKIGRGARLGELLGSKRSGVVGGVTLAMGKVSRRRSQSQEYNHPSGGKGATWQQQFYSPPLRSQPAATQTPDDLQ